MASSSHSGERQRARAGRHLDGGDAWRSTRRGIFHLEALVLFQLLLDGDPLGNQHRPVLEQYRAKAEHDLCACLRWNNDNNVDWSPDGMLYVRQWNNLQYASSAAFLLTVYSHYLAGAGAHLRCPDALAVPPSSLLALARSQADYILGDNPLRLSYMVGYGSRFPMHVHHRGASIVLHKTNNRIIGCMQGFDD